MNRSFFYVQSFNWNLSFADWKLSDISFYAIGQNISCFSFIHIRDEFRNFYTFLHYKISISLPGDPLEMIWHVFCSEKKFFFVNFVSNPKTFCSMRKSRDCMLEFYWHVSKIQMQSIGRLRSFDEITYIADKAFFACFSMGLVMLFL